MTENKNIAAKLVYGRDYPQVGTCVCHGKPVDMNSFRDQISKDEYMISRLCQETQDAFFESDE